MGGVTRLVTGSREWPNKQYATVWEECHGADFLVLGDNPNGADLWARRFAEFYQRPHIIYIADWKARRGSAGPHRNMTMVKHMVDARASDQTYKGFGTLGTFDARAFYVPWAKNIGTRDCHGRCVRAGIETVRINAK